ncbi:DUF6457 domain-containing protein [Pseudonocardia humida]|uniref:DUF6457 domain-containing protein n=1 Tax=Pseudonocardia humida TaxID=2800819 RepID=A0ABT1A0L8_9PSEU|nr:DUF6457 domain-containing protein [Pseudonocardia humida]MCO1656547.1 hypothetical protein [Pseudonocardia humida]
MSESSDAKAMSEWVTAVARELGLENAVEAGPTVDMVLDLTSDVAHGVSRPAAPVTAFLIGVAAGRADDPAVAARDYAGKVSRMAAGWDADTERAVPANDQSQRA